MGDNFAAAWARFDKAMAKKTGTKRTANAYERAALSSSNRQLRQEKQFVRAYNNPNKGANREDLKIFMKNMGYSKPERKKELDLLDISNNILEQERRNEKKLKESQLKYEDEQEAKKDWYSREVSPKIGKVFGAISDAAVDAYDFKKMQYDAKFKQANKNFARVGLDDNVQDVLGFTNKYAVQPVGKAAGATLRGTLDAISRPRYATANTQLYAAKQEAEGESWWDKHAGRVARQIPGIGPLLDPMLYGGTSPVNSIDDFSRDPRKYKGIPDAFWKGLSGKEKTTGYDVIDYTTKRDGKNNFYDSNTYKTVAGLSQDVLLDPLSYVGVGVAKSTIGGATRKAGIGKRAVESNLRLNRFQEIANKGAKPFHSAADRMQNLQQRVDKQLDRAAANAQKRADFQVKGAQFRGDLPTVDVPTGDFSNNVIRDTLASHGRNSARQVDDAGFYRKQRATREKNAKLADADKEPEISLEQWRSEFQNIDDSSFGKALAQDADLVDDAGKPLAASSLLKEVKTDLLKNNPVYRNAEAAYRKTQRGLRGPKVRRTVKGVKEAKGSRSAIRGVYGQLEKYADMAKTRKLTLDESREVSRLNRMKNTLKADADRALAIRNRMEAQAISQAIEVRRGAARGAVRPAAERFTDPDRGKYLEDLINKLENSMETEGTAGLKTELGKFDSNDFARADEADIRDVVDGDYSGRSTEAAGDDLVEERLRTSRNLIRGASGEVSVTQGRAADDFQGLSDKASIKKKQLDAVRRDKAKRSGDNPNLLAEERKLEEDIARLARNEELENSFKVETAPDTSQIRIGNEYVDLNDLILSGSPTAIIDAATRELARITTPVGKLQMAPLDIPKVFLNPKGKIRTATIDKILDELVTYVNDTGRVVVRNKVLKEKFPNTHSEVSAFLTKVVEEGNLQRFDPDAIKAIEKVTDNAVLKEHEIGGLTADMMKGQIESTIRNLLMGTKNGKTKKFSIESSPVKLNVKPDEEALENLATIEKATNEYFRKEHERLVAEINSKDITRRFKDVRREHATLRAQQTEARKNVAAAKVEVERTSTELANMNEQASAISNIMKGQYGDRRVGITLRMLSAQWELPGSASLVAAARYTGDLPVLNLVTEAYRTAFKPIAAMEEWTHPVYARNANKPNIIIKAHADMLNNVFKDMPVSDRDAAFKEAFSGSGAMSENAKIIRREFDKLVPAFNKQIQIGDQFLNMNDVMRFLPQELVISGPLRNKVTTADSLVRDMGTALQARKDVIMDDLKSRYRTEFPGKHATTEDVNAYIKKNVTEDDAKILAMKTPTDPYEIIWNTRIAIEKAAGFKGFTHSINEGFGVKDIQKEVITKKGQTVLTKEYKANRSAFDEIQKLKDKGWKTIPELGNTHLYPPESYNDIKRLSGMFDSRNVAPLMRNIDKVTTMWKVAATIYNPGYYTRNLIGEVLTGWLGGVNNPLYYKRSGEWSKHLRTYETGTLPFLQEHDSLKGYMKWAANDTSPVVARRAGEDISAIKAEALYQDQALESSFINTEFQDQVQRTAEGLRPNRVTAPVKATHKKVQELGENAENYPRKAHFLHALEHAPAKMNLKEASEYAAEQVRKYHFDYSDVTNFEKTVMMRAFPFYKWTRKAVPLMAGMLFHSPGKMSAIPKGMAAASTIGMGGNEHLDGFSPVYDEDTPEWIKDMGAYPMGTDEEGKTTYGNVVTPQIDGLRAIFEPGAAANLMANPLAKVPLELLLGKNLNSNVDGPGGEFNNWQDRLKHVLGITPGTKFASKMSGLGASDTAESPVGEPGAPMDERVFSFLTGLGAYEDPGFKKFDFSTKKATFEDSNADGTFNIDKFFKDNPDKQPLESKKYQDRQRMVDQQGYPTMEFYKKYPTEMTPKIRMNMDRQSMIDPNTGYPKPSFYKKYPKEMSPKLVKFYQYQGILDANGNFIR